MEAVKREMKSRDNLNAELRDMLSWIDDVSDDAERTLDLSATPACVQDQLDTLRQVFDVITIMMTSFNSLYCSWKNKLVGKKLILIKSQKNKEINI